MSLEMKTGIQHNVIENLYDLIQDLTDDIIYLETRSTALKNKKISVTVNENFHQRRKKQERELYTFFADYLHFLLKQKKIDPRMCPSLQHLKHSLETREAQYSYDAFSEEEEESYQLGKLLIDMMTKRNISIEMLDFIKTNGVDLLNDASFLKLFDSVTSMLNTLLVKPNVPPIIKKEIKIEKKKMEKKEISGAHEKSKKSRINKIDEQLINYLNNEETQLSDIHCCSTTASFTSEPMESSKKEKQSEKEKHTITLQIDSFLKKVMNYLLQGEKQHQQYIRRNELHKEISKKVSVGIQKIENHPKKPVRVVHFKDVYSSVSSPSSSSSSSSCALSSSKTFFNKRSNAHDGVYSKSNGDQENKNKDSLNRNQSMNTKHRSALLECSEKGSIYKYNMRDSINLKIPSKISKMKKEDLMNPSSNFAISKKEVSCLKNEGMIIEQKIKPQWMTSKKYGGIDKNGTKSKYALSSDSSLKKPTSSNYLIQMKTNNVPTNSGTVLYKIENLSKGKNVKCFFSSQKKCINPSEMKNDSLSNKSTLGPSEDFQINKQGTNYNKNSTTNKFEKQKKESKEQRDSPENHRDSDDANNSEESKYTKDSSKKKELIRKKKHLIKIKKDGNGEYIVKKEGAKSRKCIYEFEIIFDDSDHELTTEDADGHHLNQNTKVRNRTNEIVQFSFLGNGSKIENMNNMYLSMDEKIQSFPFYNRNRLGNVSARKGILRKTSESIPSDINEKDSELKRELSTIINDIKNYRINKLMEDRYNSDFMHTNKLRSIYLQLLDRQKDLEKERNFYKSELEMIQQKGNIPTSKRIYQKEIDTKELIGSVSKRTQIEDLKEKENWKKEVELKAKEQYLKEKEEALIQKEKELTEREKSFKDTQEAATKENESKIIFDEHNKKVQELEKQNKQKEVEVNELRNQNVELDKKIIQLQCEIKHCTEMLSREKVVNQNLNDKFELNLKKEEDAENKRVEEKKEEIKLLQEACVSWKTKFEKETKEKEKIEEEVKNQEKEKLELKDQVEKLLSDNTLEKFRKSVLEQVNNTDHEIKYLRDLLELFTKELENKLTREKAMNATIIQLQMESSKNKKKLEMSKKQLQNNKIEMNDLKNEIDFLNTKIENLLEAMKFLKTKVTELESTNKNIPNQKTERKENLVEQQIKQIENKTRETENKIKELEKKTKEKRNMVSKTEKVKEVKTIKDNTMQKSTLTKGMVVLPSIDIIRKNNKEDTTEKINIPQSKNHININVNTEIGKKQNKTYEMFSNTSISEAESSLLSNQETNEESSMNEIMRTSRHPINMLELSNVSTS